MATPLQIRSALLVSCLALAACGPARSGGAAGPLASPVPAPQTHPQAQENSRTPSDEPSPQDGKKSGNTSKSTVEQVRFAINASFNILNNMLKDLGADFPSMDGFFLNVEKNTIGSSSEKDILLKLQFPDGPDKSAKFSTYFFRLKLAQKESGLCSDSDLEHSFVSVTKSDEGEGLCFSIEGLTSKSSVDLVWRILSLILHNMAHLKGANESDALSIQTKAMEYFSRRYDAKWAAQARNQIPSLIKNIREDLEAAAELSKHNPDNPAIQERISNIPRLALELFGTLNKSFLDTAWQPANPLLKENFLNAFWRLADTAFSSSVDAGTSKSNYRKSGPDLKRSLAQTAKNANLLERNWLAYSSGTVKPVCLGEYDRKCELALQNWAKNAPSGDAPEGSIDSSKDTP